MSRLSCRRKRSPMSELGPPRHDSYATGVRNTLQVASSEEDGAAGKGKRFTTYESVTGSILPILLHTSASSGSPRTRRQGLESERVSDRVGSSGERRESGGIRLYLGGDKLGGFDWVPGWPPAGSRKSRRALTPVFRKRRRPRGATPARTSSGVRSGKGGS